MKPYSRYPQQIVGPKALTGARVRNLVLCVRAYVRECHIILLYIDIQTNRA